MNDHADQTIDALRGGHDYLTAVVHGLATADLTRPSGASEWDVSRSSATWAAARRSASRPWRARSSAPGPRAATSTSRCGRAGTRCPGRASRGLRDRQRGAVRGREALDPRARAELRVDLGFLPAPVDVATVAGLRLGEFTHHTWDVEVAFDRTAVLAPAAVEPLLDQSDCSSASSARSRPSVDGRFASLSTPPLPGARSGSTWSTRSRSPTSRPSPTPS